MGENLFFCRTDMAVMEERGNYQTGRRSAHGPQLVRCGILKRQPRSFRLNTAALPHTNTTRYSRA